MLKRLFEPMECDRACRVRVYTSWVILFGIVLLVWFGLDMAVQHGWLQMDNRKRGILLLGLMWILWPIVVLSLCRSYTAYHVWRQAKPSFFASLGRSASSQEAPRRGWGYKQYLAITLFASVSISIVGVFLVIGALS